MAINPPQPDIDPLLDVARLQEIADLDLFAPEVSDILGDLARDASTALNLPLGMVNIVLDTAQYVAAHHGAGGWIGEAQGTPVEWSLCRFTVLDRAPFIVDDARADERAKDSPLVTEDGLRCYAGVPLITSRGHAIGSLCVAGGEARRFRDHDIRLLRALAAQALQLIERRRLRAP